MEWRADKSAIFDYWRISQIANSHNGILNGLGGVSKSGNATLSVQYGISGFGCGFENLLTSLFNKEMVDFGLKIFSSDKTNFAALRSVLPCT